ncbi:MAG: CotH kinase family protein, partial [Planctomycetota bacterium]
IVRGGEELLSNPGFEANTSSWRITGNHIFSERSTEDAHSGEASLRLRATGSGDQKVNHIETDARTTLRNGDELTISLWLRWLCGARRLHIALYNNVLGHTVELPVPEDAGSPGRINKVRLALLESGDGNLGPVISNVIHSPAVPSSTTPIVFKARVSDSDGLTAVNAVFRTARRTAGQDDGEWQRVSLAEYSGHEDGLAGGGFFRGETPARESGERIEFFIEAVDAGSRIRTYPLEGEDEPLIFIVDDGFFPDEITAERNKLLRYRLVLSERERTTLDRRLLHSDDMVRGTFVYEEEQVFYNVGLRYRGSPWNRPPNPRMYRVRLPDDNPLRGNQRRVNLSRYGDDQNEGVAYHMIRQLNRPWGKAPHSPHYEYIMIDVNGRQHNAVPMAEIQPIDSNYVGMWFPGDSDGFAYKISGKIAFTDSGQHKAGSPDWTRFRFYGDSEENVRFYFNPGVGRREDNLEPVVDFLRLFDTRQTPNEEFARALESMVNLEASLRVFAARDLIADWDTIGIGNGQNAFLYYAPNEGRMYLLPWDMDHAFERANQAMLSNADSGMGRILRHPKFSRQYARILMEGIEGGWARDVLGPFIDEVASVTSPARSASPTGIQSFIVRRISTIPTLLGPALNAEFTAPRVVPLDRELTTIQGRAPLDVDQILVSVDGGEFENTTPEWSTLRGQRVASEWALSFEGLAGPRHEIDLFAFDVAGDFTGSLSVVVVDTEGWEAPRIDEISPAFGTPEGGTEVTLNGAGFQEGLEVRFGGVPAQSIEIESSERVRATTPRGNDGRVVDLLASNTDGQEFLLEDAFTYGEPEVSFIRGDGDGNGVVNLSDAIAGLRYLFFAGPLTCADAADSDDDGSLSVSDAVTTLQHLFSGGPPLAAPFPKAGPDPSADNLDCAPRG